MSPLDTQVGGDHYKSMPIQPIEFCMANGLDACQTNVVKYVTRFRSKNGIQDLEKAKHYIDLLISFEKQKEDEQATQKSFAFAQEPVKLDKEVGTPTPIAQATEPECDCIICRLEKMAAANAEAIGDRSGVRYVSIGDILRAGKL